MKLDSLTDAIFEGREEAFGVAIDPINSKDKDDAIWYQKDHKNHLVSVSVSDVGSVVPVDSEIDHRAREQGLSLYLSGGIRPMLPRELSEDLLSLLEGEKRPTITISLPISSSLQIGDPTIRRTFLSSSNLSYEHAEKIMKSNEHTFLGEAYSLARQLFEMRRATGAIAFFDKRAGLTTTEEGDIQLLDKTERYNSHLLVQEFMIAANIAVAEYFKANNIPGLYRNHTARIAGSNQPDFLQDIEIAVFERDFDKLQLHNEGLAFNFNRAEYSPILQGHFGLNLPAYMHFTSPIRRYIDLVNNRQLSAHILGEAFPYGIDDLVCISEHINGLQIERAASTKTYFRDQTLERIKRIVASQDPSSLNSQDFSRALRMTATGSLDNVALAANISERLSAGQLAEVDLHTILLGTNLEDQTWAQIREDVLNSFNGQPNIATYIVTMIGKGSEETPHNHNTHWNFYGDETFTCVANLTIGSKRYSSAPQTDTSRNLSQQLADFSLLANIAGVDIVVLRPQVPGKTSAKETPENYKSILNELCQRNGWEPPIYNLVQTSGQAHEPKHTVVAEIPGTQYTSDPSTLTGLIRAQQLAAANLFDKFPELNASPPEKSQMSRKRRRQQVLSKQAMAQRDGKYISKLEGLHRRNNKPVPIYTEEEIDYGFIYHCCALTPDNDTVTFSAAGSDPNIAKRNAARMAFEELSPMYMNK